MASKYQIKITNGAAMVLSAAINAPESIKGIRPYKAACDVIENLKIDAPRDAKGAFDEERFPGWRDKPHAEFELTEYQRDVCKDVIINCADRGILTKNKSLNELISVLGLDSQ